MTDWEKRLEKHEEGNFLQSEQWAKMNEKIGHKPIMTPIGEDGLCLMIIKNAKRGRHLEIPGGPLIDWKNPKEVKEAVKKIEETAKENHCVFARIRPQLKKTDENLKILKDAGFKLAPMHLAAEHTVILDLTKPEETIYAEMRRQTRYEVKHSARLNLTVEKSNSEKIFKEFHEVQLETAKRQNFFPPDLATLLAEREAFGDQAWIYVAKTGKNTVFKDKKYEPGLPIAYGLVLKNGVEAEYYEAASTDLHRVLSGAYALQREIIKDLKAQGIKRYNLWGIAPPNSPNHRYAGVTTFKKGFGGEVVEFVPAHDLIIDKVKYLKNFVIETARKKRRHL